MIRRRRSLLRRALISLTLTSALPLLLLGCPKKTPPPPPDAEPPPTASSSGPTVLTPLDDDAGDQDAAEAAAPHATGHPVNVNTAHIKQCCNALRTQAKQLGASPEANILLGFAAQCDQVAVQAGGGNAPEFAAFRQLIKGRTLPAGCSGL